ncbi:CPBP family intramembrane glutamic endopeptidase [Helicobacter cappadocius]|uniref:CPBP family intramembrane metalloprotease n=1 Tax=Helicobacter cappadocius TaxID=3063998 RepID=A0AA90SSL8_9HELI|nr:MULTISPECIES: CPBP family intramembrane glutamic endopeptidase [unclassified Helicobacter]MDO7252951.1 CPBP family intramembrane metalloprotease [Helicobacter sp. faydin-H75]MDP2539059.1 CPBP family intramembrane metalloprotease [Helicobacter sp. faydin-H76]
MWITLAFSLVFLSWKKNFAFLLLIVVLISALFEGFITLYAIGILLVFFCIGIIHKYYNYKSILSILIEFLLFMGAIALFFHLITGFNNPKILDKVLTGSQSSLYSMYFNLDKSIVPFVLILALPTLFYTKPIKHQTWWKWLILSLSIPILLGIAVLLGGLKLEFALPSWIWQFILANLFFVSLAEETLFRGYIQKRLNDFIGSIPALLITAVLFGLIHYHGGYLLIVFATLAGLIYGIAWMWSGRIWISTFFHFGLNLIHLLFFTYPAYQPHFQ